MVRPPPRERVSKAAAEGRRAECVCEAESELESVAIFPLKKISTKRPEEGYSSLARSLLEKREETHGLMSPFTSIYISVSL